MTSAEGLIRKSRDQMHFPGDFPVFASQCFPVNPGMFFLWNVTYVLLMQSHVYDRANCSPFPVGKIAEKNSLQECVFC